MAKLAYIEKDDGTAETLAQGFDPDEFARFASPSPGPAPPQNVVHGKVPEGHACLFSHYIRRTEGDARQWYVAIVDTPLTLNNNGLIRCRSRNVHRVKEIGDMPELEMPGDPKFSAAFRTQAEDKASAQRCLNSRAQREILGALLPLGYPVDVQIVGSRIAIYPADRNYSPANAQSLIDLLNSARRAAGALAKQA